MESQSTITSIVNDNVKKCILLDFEKKIEFKNEKLLDQNISLIQKMMDEGTSIIALSKFNQDLFLTEKDGLSKQHYKFPRYLNVGELVNWHTSPSKVLDEKMYKTSISMLMPTAAPIGFFQNKKNKDEINTVMESVGLKMISALPKSFARVLIFDKAGAGQNFPNLLKLNDKFTNGRVISEDDQIEKELENIKFSMSAVSSSITANGFETIEDYNNNTDEITQPYRFLFISGFPLGFSKKAAESLISILESGPKAGIHTIISLAVNMKNGRNQSVSGVSLEDITKYLMLFEFSDRPNEFTKKRLLNYNVSNINAPFPAEQDIKLLYNNSFKINFEIPSASIISERINILNDDISKINIKPIIGLEKTIPKVFWGNKAGAGVSIPFAKNGIENVYINLGINQFGEDEGTHHGLIGGSTGSGKTVLLHDIILHAAMRYSPEEIRFWLLDYKEGTEFATYANFPYVQILSMESEIEFGQEVLENAIVIMKERGRLFKEMGVSNLKNYNEKVASDKKLYRIVIIIDEFQALFPKSPRIAAKTNELIDQILRLGRSFGINLLMATQTLKGVDMDSQLMSNLPLRIGLKMDAKDVTKLFDENNHAPKSLSDPGEGIYNKQFGLSSANNYFQAYFASNEGVDYTKELIVSKIKDSYPQFYIKDLMDSRFVYTGDKPGDILLNKEYQSCKDSKFRPHEFFIGENAGLSKKHSSMDFKREFSENLIIVGTDLIKAAELHYYIINQLSNNEYPYKIYFGNFNKGLDEKFKLIFRNENIIFMDNKNQKVIFDDIYKEFERRKTLSEDELTGLERIIVSSFFIESSLIFSDNSFNNKYLEKYIEIISEGPEIGIHSIYFATDINTYSSIGFNKLLDKFKKKIAIPGIGNFMKIFGEAGEEVKLSKSKNVLLASKGDINEGVFKFKPYIKETFHG